MLGEITLVTGEDVAMYPAHLVEGAGLHPRRDRLGHPTREVVLP